MALVSDSAYDKGFYKELTRVLKPHIKAVNEEDLNTQAIELLQPNNQTLENAEHYRLNKLMELNDREQDFYDRHDTAEKYPHLVKLHTLVNDVYEQNKIPLDQ